MHKHTKTILLVRRRFFPTVSTSAMDYYQAVDAVLAVGAMVADNGTLPVSSPSMFAQMNPYFFGFLGAAVAISVSVVGAAWYV